MGAEEFDGARWLCVDMLEAELVPRASDGRCSARTTTALCIPWQSENDGKWGRPASQHTSRASRA